MRLCHHTEGYVTLLGFLVHIIVLLSGCAEQSPRTAPSTRENSDPNRSFLEKVMADESRIMRERVAAGADINRIEPGLGTPLFQAIYPFHNPETVRFLLDRGADANLGDVDNTTPLYYAVMAEEDYAAREDVLATVRLLLEHGADVNARIKAEDGFSWVEGETPLHQAVSWEYIDYDSDEHVGYSNLPIVNCLLQQGAEVNARDAWGNTPLYGAVFSGYPEVVSLLLAWGADINVACSEHGDTPLHYAVHTRYLEVTELLLQSGADVHARNKSGETPLHQAALRRDAEMVQLLVAHGADLQARSQRGETPQDFLNEPNLPDPIMLTEPNANPYRLIVTDGLVIRRVLQAEQIDYETIWYPTPGDLQGLDAALEACLKRGGPKRVAMYLDPEYVLENFGRYSREYAGFVLRGKKHLYCNMVIHAEEVLRPRNGFCGGLDGGCALVRFIFVAQTREVVWASCNNE